MQFSSLIPNQHEPKLFNDLKSKLLSDCIKYESFPRHLLLTTNLAVDVAFPIEFEAVTVICPEFSSHAAGIVSEETFPVNCS